MNINEITLLGRAGQEPQVKTLSNGTEVMELSIATSNSYKKGDEWVQETDWHKIKVFKPNKLTMQIQKGDFVAVHGSLRHDMYEKDGETKHSYYILAKTCLPVHSKGEHSNDAGGNSGYSKPKPKPVAGKSNNPFSGNDVGDDLPF